MNAELFLDQVPDPVTGPQRRLVAEFLGSFEQPSHQPLTLLLIQQRFAPRTTNRIQRPFSFFGNGPRPPAHGLTADLDAPRHFTLVVTLLQQLEGPKTSPLQCSEVALYTSSITHIFKTFCSRNLLRYIMRASVSARR